MNYISIKDASASWNLSERRIRVLCNEGRIPGAKKDRKSWLIPENANKPSDVRSYKNINLGIGFKDRIAELDRKLLLINKSDNLTDSEKNRLKEEFVVQYTYDSNAIEGSTEPLVS